MIIFSSIALMRSESADMLLCEVEWTQVPADRRSGRVCVRPLRDLLLPLPISSPISGVHCVFTDLASAKWPYCSQSGYIASDALK